jgi:hypothetical protein
MSTDNQALLLDSQQIDVWEFRELLRQHLRLES